MNKLLRHITDETPQLNTYLVFRNVLLGFLLYYSLTLIPMHEMLFGEDQVVPPHALSSYMSYFIHILWYNPVYDYWWVFFIVLWVGIISIYRDRNAVFWMVVVYWVTMNVVHKVYMVNTSGHQLLYVFLLFFIFVEWGRSRFRRDPVMGTAMMNSGILACKIQLCLVYLVSGLYKVLGEDWLSGKALGYVLNVDQFSLGWIEGMSIDHPLLLFATYVTLAYQLLFPVLVWIRRIKWPFLAIGIVTHLSIAFVMGLFDFGLIMTLSYLIFVPDDVARGWRSIVASLGKSRIA